MTKSAKNTLLDAAALVASGWTSGPTCRDDLRRECDAQHATYYTLGGALWAASGRDPRAYVASRCALGDRLLNDEFGDGDHCARVLREAAKRL